MKRLFLIAASLLVATAVAPVASAEPVAVNLENAQVEGYITPANLVTLAERGAFDEQGISGYGIFLSANQSGRLTPEEIVQAAIAAEQLPASALEDEGYLHDVSLQLQVRRQAR
ncbi:hypothetical protein HC928_16520 [bacterium]|nr:hypothetical protein [bacterium]